MNHYECLNLEPNATAEQIKSAYKKLAKLRHPDKNLERPEAVQEFQRLHEAYAVLSNPEEKELYDAYINGDRAYVPLYSNPSQPRCLLFWRWWWDLSPCTRDFLKAVVTILVFVGVLASVAACVIVYLTNKRKKGSGSGSGFTFQYNGSGTLSVTSDQPVDVKQVVGVPVVHLEGLVPVSVNGHVASESGVPSQQPRVQGVSNTIAFGANGNIITKPEPTLEPGEVVAAKEQEPQSTFAKVADLLFSPLVDTVEKYLGLGVDGIPKAPSVYNPKSVVPQHGPRSTAGSNPGLFAGAHDNRQAVIEGAVNKFVY